MVRPLHIGRGVYRMMLLCGCLGAGCVSATDDLPPPYDVPWRVTAMATSGRTTLMIASFATTSTTIEAFGGGVPLPLDPATGYPIELVLPTARAVAVGRGHGCIVSTIGSTHCWGNHANGALGAQRGCLPGPYPTSPPQCTLGAGALPQLPELRAIAAGDDVTCGITRDDRVVCWGARGPALGGSVVPALDPPTPVRLADGTLFAASELVIHGAEVCAIATDATVWCWGEPHGAVPRQQPGTGVRALAIGGSHRCQIADGGLHCTGSDRNGQLAVPAALVDTAVDVVAGDRHTCALDRDGVVWCWGSNEVGQLGRPEAVFVGAPAPVMPDVIELTAGFAHTCARGRQQTTCWGLGIPGSQVGL